MKATPKLPLPESEWKFDHIRNVELEPCFLYEYGRARAKKSERIGQLLDEFQVVKKTGDRKKITRFLLDFPRVVPEALGPNDVVRSSFPLISPTFFPRTPWRELKKAERMAVLEHFRSMADRWGNLPCNSFDILTERELLPTGGKSLEDFRYVHECLSHKSLDQTEYGFFAIDWNTSGSEIRRAFEEWLETAQEFRRKMNLPALTSPVNRGGFRDKLNWLGCLRVKEYYPSGRLADYADTNLKVASPCSHTTDLYRNAKKAEKVLAELFPGTKGIGIKSNP